MGHVNRNEEHELARRAIGGDSDAVRDFWRLSRRWVAAVLLAHMPRDCELEDLLQDVALTLVNRISDVRDPAATRGWLRMVAVNTAKTAARKRRPTLRLVPAPEDVPSDVPDLAGAGEADDPALREEAKRALEAARELPGDYSEPLLLRCVHGMTYQQISEALGLPVTTIETRLARARRMLRENLSAGDGRSAATGA